MSKTVDERVVSMQFDNQHFEKNVQTTMSSLDKLKQSLNLTGASKGLENVDAAAKKINFSPLGGAVETVQAKFSALEVMAVTALANITNSAVNAGKRLVSAFTIQPIKTGLSEYETQINAVQTILANTESKGTTLNDVNAALDTLNTYADKTIYNFTEMTRNIGTFTAAGIDLDTSVNSIQGIANLAAVSGSTSQQASTAMYQLSQALASGTVKLMDWNSVVNAGMGGQVFQDALKETARVHGVAIDDMIEKNGSFRETLQEGWLTSDILTETLEKFTMGTEGLTKAEIEANREKLRSIGYTEEQIEAIFKLGNTATNAATKVKTFTQLKDTLMEAAQSGWTQTWELLIGDFEEAKALWTSVSDVLGGFINATSEARNNLLAGALESNWEKMTRKIEEAGIEGGVFEEKIRDIAKEQNIDLDALIEKHGSLKEAFQNGAISSEVLTKALTELEKSTKGADGLADSCADLVAGITELGGRELVIDALKNVFEALVSVVKPIKEAFREIFPPATSEQLFSLIERFHAFTETLKLNEEQTDKVKSTFKGLFAAVDIVLTFIKELAGGVKTLLGNLTGLGDSILNTTGSFGDWLSGLRDTVKETDIFGEAVGAVVGFLQKGIDKLKEFFSAVKAKFAAPGFETFLGVMAGIWNIIKVIGSEIAKIGGSVGEALASAFEGGDIGKSLDIVNTGIFGGILLGIKKFIDGLGDTFEGVGDIVENVSGILDSVRGCFEAYQQNLQAQTLMTIAKAIGILAASIVVISLINPEKLDASLGAISVLFIELLGAMALLSRILGDTKGLVKASAAMTTMATAVLILAAALLVVSKVDTEKMVPSILGIMALTGTIVVAATAMSKIKGKVIKGATGLVIFASAIAILAGVCKSLSELNIEQLCKGLLGVGVLMATVAIFVNKTDFGPKMFTNALGVVALAGAMKILASACKDFGSMNWETLGRGLAGMAGALLAITLAMKLMGSTNAFAIGAGLVLVASAVTILAHALGTMGGMSWESIGKGLATLAGSLLILAGALHLMKGTLAGSAALLIAAGAIAIFAPTLVLLGSMSWESIGKGLLALAGAFAVVGVAGLLLGPLVPTILGLAAAFALIGVGAVAVGAGMMLIAVAFSTLATATAAGATAIVAALSIIIMGIINLIPSIAIALADGLVRLIQALAASIPALAEGLLTIILGVLEAFARYAPQIVEVLFDLIISLLDALAEKIPQLVKAGLNFIMQLFAGIIDALGDIDTEVLIKGLLAAGLMAALIYAFSAMLPLIPAAMSGVIGMGIVIAELALVLAAIGLLGQIPGLNWLINEGGEVLGNIGTAIGKLVGGLIGGAGEQITSSLPEMANNLSAFAENLSPFLETVSGIDASMMEGAKSLAEVLLILTAAELLDGLAGLIGGTDMSGFADQLVAFGEGMIAFSDTISKGTINEEAINKAAAAGKAMAEMADSIPKTGGIWQDIVGETDMGNFGKSIVAFGKAIVDFSNIDGIDSIDATTVSGVAAAGTAMAELADSIPKSDGIWQNIVGETDMGNFGKSIVAFGKSLVDFTNVEGMSGLDIAAITTAVDAGKKLADFASYLEDKDLFGMFGDSDLDDFSEPLTGFGKAIGSFSEEIGSMSNAAAISTAVNAAKSLAGMCEGDDKAIWNLINAFEGASITDTTVAQMGNFGSMMKTFSSNAAGISLESVQNGVAAGKALVGLAEAMSDADIDSSDGSGLTSFGIQMVSFSGQLKSFANGISGIDTEKLASDVDNIKSVTSTLKTIGTTTVTGFSDSFTNAGSSVNSSISSMLSSAIKTITGRKEAFLNAGKSLVNSFQLGMMASKAKAESTAKLIATNSASKVSTATNYTKFYNAGKYLVQGFAAGISAETWRAEAKAAAMASAAETAAKEELDINSPSKVFRAIGYSVPEGFAMGIDRMAYMASDSSEAMADTAINSMKGAISRIGDAISTDIDAQPTIRPVLDLSEVEAGAGTISSMFGSGVSIGAWNNARAINTMMNDRIQNGGNDDVVSAINKLNKSLGNVGNTTYNVGGVTYDDGTNVSNAVQALIRAVTVERRA